MPLMRHNVGSKRKTRICKLTTNKPGSGYPLRCLKAPAPFSTVIAVGSSAGDPYSLMFDPLSWNIFRQWGRDQSPFQSLPIASLARQGLAPILLPQPWPEAHVSAPSGSSLAALWSAFPLSPWSLNRRVVELPIKPLVPPCKQGRALCSILSPYTANWSEHFAWLL